MRAKRTCQMSIYEAFCDHEIGQQLKAISGWLDRHVDVLDWIEADLRSKEVKATGRCGMSVEAVLRCGILKQYWTWTYEELAFYLRGRYLYRGVIQEKDILTCENGQVTFRYQNSKTRKMERRTVSGVEFLRLLLAHVLPKGFRRARNYGFLHPNSKRLIQVLQYLHKIVPAQTPITKRPALRCRCCGGEMTIVRTRIMSALVPTHPPDGAARASVM